MPDPEIVRQHPARSEADLVDDLLVESEARQNARLDEALDETFPASDPISSSKID